MLIVYALIGIPASLAVARSLFLFCTDPGDRIRVRVEMAGRRIAACFAALPAFVLVATCDGTGGLLVVEGTTSGAGGASVASTTGTGGAKPDASLPTCSTVADCPASVIANTQCSVLVCDPTGISTRPGSPVLGCYAGPAAVGSPCSDGACPGTCDATTTCQPVCADSGSVAPVVCMVSVDAIYSGCDGLPHSAEYIRLDFTIGTTNYSCDPTGQPTSNVCPTGTPCTVTVKGPIGKPPTNLAGVCL